MSAYRLDDERAIRVGRLVEDWAKSGLLTPDQRDVIAPQLAVDLRRTNNYLRATLFVFGGVILQSTLGLMAIMLGGLLDETLGAALGLAAGGVCYWPCNWSAATTSIDSASRKWRHCRRSA